MGAFKLDLMTILVLFVVLSVIFTMTSGMKESRPAAPAATVQKPVVQGMSNVSTTELSTANFSNLSPKVTGTRFAARTWN